MRAELWPRVADLMHGALDVAPPDRLAWVTSRAEGDGEVIAEVERLLAAHDAAGGFLLEPALASPAAAAAVRDALPAAGDAGLAPGSTLGPYRVIRALGRGGMGAVYLAARADDVFEKQVAIKVAPGALADDALRARFARERQILAALDHPGIARVLDGGAAAGVQYLVMEYVDGTPIDEYCRTGRLDLRARLRLFLEVCDAVQYAHDRLVVHCDIKAANVLVGRDGRARLLDFGIARLLAPDDPSREAAATRFQAWTPESASPEQVRGGPTTVATDVYGLGTLLYRLIAGRPVFDLSGLDRLARAQVICGDTPPPPGAAAAAGVRARGGRAASADLDAIALKTLHKEPERRYRSVAHLSDDVERWLAGRPVLAAPDSVAYRARRFVGRHPLATAATTIAIAAVLAATIAALWQARRADLERDRAEARLADVRRLANTLIFDLYDRIANTPDATPIRRDMVQQGLAYLDRLADEGSRDPQVSVELAGAYARLAQVQGQLGQSNLGDREGAVSSLEKGRAVLAGIRSGNAVPVEVELTDLRLLGRLTVTVPDGPRTRQLVSEGVERSAALLRRHPDRLDVIDAAASAYFSAAMLPDTDQTAALWIESNRLYRALTDRQPGNADSLRSLGLTEKYLGAYYERTNRLDLARARYERALEIDRQVQQLRPDDRRTVMDLAFDLGSLAALLWKQTPPDRPAAAALYRESLGLRERASAQDPQDVFARQAVGFALMQLARLSREMESVEAALDYATRSVAVYESLPAGDQLARRGHAWWTLALVSRQAGREAAACRAFRRAGDYYGLAMSIPLQRQMMDGDTEAQLAGALKGCPP